MKYIVTALGVVLLVASGYVLQNGEHNLVKVPSCEVETSRTQGYFQDYKSATSGATFSVEITAPQYAAFAGIYGQRMPSRAGFEVSASARSIVSTSTIVLNDYEYCLLQNSSTTPVYLEKLPSQAQVQTTTL